VDGSVRLPGHADQALDCGRPTLASGPQGYAYCVGNPMTTGQGAAYALGTADLPDLTPNGSTVRWSLYSGAETGYGQVPGADFPNPTDTSGQSVQIPSTRPFLGTGDADSTTTPTSSTDPTATDPTATDAMNKD